MPSKDCMFHNRRPSLPQLKQPPRKLSQAEKHLPQQKLVLLKERHHSVLRQRQVEHGFSSDKETLQELMQMKDRTSSMTKEHSEKAKKIQHVKLQDAKLVNEINLLEVEQNQLQMRITDLKKRHEDIIEQMKMALDEKMILRAMKSTRKSEVLLLQEKIQKLEQSIETERIINLRAGHSVQEEINRRLMLQHEQKDLQHKCEDDHMDYTQRLDLRKNQLNNLQHFQSSRLTRIKRKEIVDIEFASSERKKTRKKFMVHIFTQQLCGDLLDSKIRRMSVQYQKLNQIYHLLKNIDPNLLSLAESWSKLPRILQNELGQQEAIKRQLKQILSTQEREGFKKAPVPDERPGRILKRKLDESRRLQSLCNSTMKRWKVWLPEQLDRVGLFHPKKSVIEGTMSLIYAVRTGLLQNQ